MGVYEFGPFTRGLWLNPPPDLIPVEALRRSKGTHGLPTGSVRSRNGSTLLYSVSAHSLFRFIDVRFQGVGTVLNRNDVAGRTGLDGTRLAFAPMQTAEGQGDLLYVAGGGDLFKVNSTGGHFAWGIPSVGAPTLAVISGGALNGTYKYRQTYVNLATSVARGNSTGEASISPVNQKVVVTVAAAPADSDASSIEIWRTKAGGTVFFRLNGAGHAFGAAVEENIADSALESAELPTDNGVPDDTFEDCFGPHQGRMWWARVNEAGKRGRVIFSPIGRPESQGGGFIQLAADDDKTQKLMGFGGSLFCFSEFAIHEIISETVPFRFARVHGSPGTTLPHTVTWTPFGIFYIAQDGPRLFDGVTSRPAGQDQLGALWRGEGRGIPDATGAFEGVVATWARGEWFIGDVDRCYAFNPIIESWREVGVGVSSLYWEPDSDKLIAGLSSGKVVILEDEATFDDAGSRIEFEIETKTISLPGQLLFVQRFEIDTDTSLEDLTVSAVLDNGVVDLGTIRTGPRSTVEVPVMLAARRFAVRIRGSLLRQVHINHIRVFARETTSGLA